MLGSAVIAPSCPTTAAHAAFIVAAPPPALDQVSTAPRSTAKAMHSLVIALWSAPAACPVVKDASRSARTSASTSTDANDDTSVAAAYSGQARSAAEVEPTVPSPPEPHAMTASANVDVAALRENERWTRMGNCLFPSDGEHVAETMKGARRTRRGIHVERSRPWRAPRRRRATASSPAG
jgi:hypothetical protein